MPIDEKTKAYLTLKKIKKHFEYHHYFTTDDLEQFEREVYQAEVRRKMPEDEGAPVLDLDFIDFP